MTYRSRGFWPTLVTALLFFLLIGLGTWQVQRLHWKEDLIATMNRRMRAPPVDVASFFDEREANYRFATAAGQFRHDLAFYRLAIAPTGEGGYHVLTPFLLADGRFLLVDRGWVPYDRRPAAGEAARFSRPPGVVAVAGILRLPESHWNQPANDPARNDWYGVDLVSMAKIAGFPAFLPYVLELDATPNPDGYPVGGQTRVTLPNDHLGYALTWYGLAGALLVIYGLAVFRKSAADCRGAVSKG